MQVVTAVMSAVLMLAPDGVSAPELRLDLLGAPLARLSAGDRRVLDEAVGLIRKGDHTLALARLSALKNGNPDNGALRVVASYALLQAGNLLGAFDEARKADTRENTTGYICLFLGKVALLTGNTAACDRELKHLSNSKDLAREVAELQRERQAVSPARK
jgi:predicted Zn-dependent protease